MLELFLHVEHIKNILCINIFLILFIAISRSKGSNEFSRSISVIGQKRL